MVSQHGVNNDVDAKRLTEHAVHMCRDLFINSDELIDKPIEEFMRIGGIGSSTPGEVPLEIAELRYNHYQNKRRSNALF